jgi:hypothetical protein
VHTFRFNGHSPADPEHERGRKQEKSWAREKADPIAIFESELIERKIATREELDEIKARANKECKDSVKFANDSPAPPAGLAKELEFPDPPDTDYNLKEAPKVHFFLLSFSYSTQQETSWWHQEATVAIFPTKASAHRSRRHGEGRLIAGVGRKWGGEEGERAREFVLLCSCVCALKAGGMRRAGLSR